MLENQEGNLFKFASLFLKERKENLKVSPRKFCQRTTNFLRKKRKSRETMKCLIAKEARRGEIMKLLCILKSWQKGKLQAGVLNKLGGKMSTTKKGNFSFFLFRLNLNEKGHDRVNEGECLNESTFWNENQRDGMRQSEWKSLWNVGTALFISGGSLLSSECHRRYCF